MKIYSWNVNGIRAVLRKDAFHPFLEAEAPDILCLQETKVDPSIARLEHPSYREFWNCAAKKGYSGTAIFSKTEPRQVMCDLHADVYSRYGTGADAYGDPNSEGRILTAEYEQFFLVTVYTPNAKEDLSRVPLRRDYWDPAFLAHCRHLEKTKPVVFCGDLNVAHTEMDLAHPKANRGKKGFTDEERAGFQAFLDAGFVDTLRLFKEGNGFYTWWSTFGGARAKNVGWRIDYVLVSAALRDKVIAADIHPAVMGSDHCPVSVTLDL
jgi:exodeoxyribonuclease-3